MTYSVKNLRKDLWLYTREINDYLWGKCKIYSWYVLNIPLGKI